MSTRRSSSTPTSKPNTPDAYLDVRGAAAVLGVGRRSVFRLIQQGSLRAVAVNDRGDLRIRRAWLDAYAEKFAERHAAQLLHRDSAQLVQP